VAHVSISGNPAKVIEFDSLSGVLSASKSPDYITIYLPENKPVQLVSLLLIFSVIIIL